jgi:hypothetical protein
MKWLQSLFGKGSTPSAAMSSKEIEKWIFETDASWEICGTLVTRQALRSLPLLFSGEPRLGYGTWYEHSVGSIFRCIAIAHFSSISHKNIVLSLSDKAIRNLSAHSTDALARQRKEQETFELTEAKRITGYSEVSEIKNTSDSPNVYDFIGAMREAGRQYDPHGTVFSAARYLMMEALACFAHSSGDGGRKYTGKSHSQIILRDFDRDLRKALEHSLSASRKTENESELNFVASAFSAELNSEICNLRINGFNPNQLHTFPLWRGKMPDLLASCWANRATGLPEAEGWGIWFDWYERRLAGGELDSERDKFYARLPIELWNQPSADINNFLSSSLKVHSLSAASE